MSTQNNGDTFQCNNEECRYAQNGFCSLKRPDLATPRDGAACLEELFALEDERRF